MVPDPAYSFPSVRLRSPWPFLIVGGVPPGPLLPISGFMRGCTFAVMSFLPFFRTSALPFSFSNLFLPFWAFLLPISETSPLVLERSSPVLTPVFGADPLSVCVQSPSL